MPAFEHRRAIGTGARAYGIVGGAAVLLLAVFAAIIALPIVHLRHVSSPSSIVVSDYLTREIVAGIRLAIIGVAIGVTIGRRWPAVAAMIVFLAIDALAEVTLPGIQDYGPIGALNTFSDPSHHQQLSLAAGSAVALAWALCALFAATLISERRYHRSRRSTVDLQPSGLR